jgi:hypothetical protein
LQRNRDVCFAPESGHVQHVPTSAKGQKQTFCGAGHSGNAS